MSKTVTYADFDLHKVKLTGKGVEANFYDIQNPNKEVTVKGADGAHPDLVDALKSFNTIMAESLGLLSGWDYAREHTRINEEALRGAKRGYNEEILRCEPSGVIFLGEDDTAGIQVTGSIKTENSSTGLTTPRVTFSEAEGEILPTAFELAETLKKEVWSYLFKGKKAQKELFEESEDKPKGGLNVA